MSSERNTRSIALPVRLMIGTVWALVATAASADEPQTAPRFERDVVPILKAYCWKCHGGEARVADLDARALPLLLRGGKSGPAVQRGASQTSLLYQKLAAQEMPPKGELQPTDEHRELLRRWLDAGAQADYDTNPSDAEHVDVPSTESMWAFRPPVRPAVPEVKNAARARTAIDPFLLSKLEAAGLDFAPPADRRVLIRRLSFDVLGLPPDPAELEAFLNSSEADGPATAALIERLLASPQYGERWGRHWLDAAGYVDTIGSDNDASIIEPREGIWRYRDWVVRALNADMAYDQFLLEQIAGDELVDWRNAAHFTPELQDRLIATGFLRQAADTTYAPELNTADIRHQVLYDTLQILGTNVLGLTLHCCQCHDHKFDPLLQSDYFRIAAVFSPAYDVQNWKHSKDRFLPDVSAAEKQAIDDHNASTERRLGEHWQQIQQIRQPFRDRLIDTKLSTLPEAIRADVRTAVGTPAEKRTEVQKYLADKLGSTIAVTDAEIDAARDEPAKRTETELRRQMNELVRGKRSYGKIQALWDSGPPPPSYLYRRGDYTTPGETVRPGVIAALNPPSQFREFVTPAKENVTSGYRTALARWLIQPDHPLTARVMVNRVWQHYFGRGIVATTENFGPSGSPPTHPELLDHLATEFVAHGWSLKWLHRQILNSAAYQQSLQVNDDARQIDPDNALLGRMPVKRLESESVRDAMLAVSGVLDPLPGGPPVPLKPNADGSVEIDVAKCTTPTAPFRRSLYVFCRRNYQLSELSVFDQPAIAHNCTARPSSAVVLQSLSMLNGRFAFEMAERLAERIRHSAGNGTSERIDAAFRYALSRSPFPEEIALCTQHLQTQTERYQSQKSLAMDAAADAALIDLCQMLLNTNEFLYVE